VSERRNVLHPAVTLALILACAAPATADATSKVIRGAEFAAAAAAAPAPSAAQPAPAKPAPAKTAPAAKPPAAKATAPRAGTTTTATVPKGLSLPSRRPIVLDALHVEGRTDAPRVLFVHAGPTVALEDAPAHPSYLRDDFTAALSSPVRVRVRTGELARPTTATTAGGTR
jgi:hypothetical protein